MVYSEGFTSEQKETPENKLEAMKMILKEPLNLFLKERLHSRREHEQKDAFLVEFNNFGVPEKRTFRDYISELMKNPELSGDDYAQLNELFTQMSKMDKLEVYACISNSCYQRVNDDGGDIIINGNNNNVTIYEGGQNQQQPGYETMQNAPIFNVSGTINKKVATLGKGFNFEYEHKNFEINEKESSVSPLENGGYEITLISGRKIGGVLRGKDEERIKLYPTDKRGIAIIKNDKGEKKAVQIFGGKINVSMGTTTYNLQLYGDLSAFGTSGYQQPQINYQNVVPQYQPPQDFYKQQGQMVGRFPERPRIIHDPRSHTQRRHHHER